MRTLRCSAACIAVFAVLWDIEYSYDKFQGRGGTLFEANSVTDLRCSELYSGVPNILPKKQ
jgi:hypothetical protein